MKKITSILVLICVFACSSHVFAHDNGMKKPIGISNASYSFESNATVVSFNYETGEVAENASYAPFILKTIEKTNFETILKSFDKDVSHILILNISNDLKNIKSNISYALAPNRLCIEIMRTLQLTHKEIELIQQALCIAEREYASVQKKLNELSVVRNSSYNEDNSISLKGLPFGELNDQIADGQKDY